MESDTWWVSKPLAGEGGFRESKEAPNVGEIPPIKESMLREGRRRKVGRCIKLHGCTRTLQHLGQGFWKVQNLVPPIYHVLR